MDVRENLIQVLDRDDRADGAGDDRLLPDVLEHTLHDLGMLVRRVVGHELAVVPVMSEVQVGLRVVRQVREEDQHVLHVLEERGDALETHAVGQSTDVLDGRVRILLLVDHLAFVAAGDVAGVDVRQRQQVLEDDVGGDDLVHGRTGRLALSSEQREPVDFAVQHVQVRLEVLAQVGQDVGVTNGLRLRHVDGADVHVGVDAPARHVVVVDAVAPVVDPALLVLGLADDAVVDVSQSPLEHLEVTEVEAQHLSFLSRVENMFRRHLLERVVDDGVRGGADLVVPGRHVRPEGRVSAAQVFLGVTGVQTVADQLDRHALQDGVDGSRGIDTGSHRTSRDGDVARGAGHGGLEADQVGDEHVDDDHVRIGHILQKGVGSASGRDHGGHQTSPILHVGATITGVGAVGHHHQPRGRDAVHGNGELFLDSRAIDGLGQGDDDFLQVDTLGHEVGVVDAFLLGRSHSQVEQVHDLVELDDAVGDQLALGVVSLQRHQFLQLHADRRRITQQVEHRDLVGVAVADVAGDVASGGQVVELVIVDDVADHGADGRTGVHDAGHQTLVGLEQRDGHGHAQVGEDLVDVGTERFGTGDHDVVAERHVGQSRTRHHRLGAVEGGGVQLVAVVRPVLDANSVGGLRVATDRVGQSRHGSSQLLSADAAGGAEAFEAGKQVGQLVGVVGGPTQVLGAVDEIAGELLSGEQVVLVQEVHDLAVGITDGGDGLDIGSAESGTGQVGFDTGQSGLGLGVLQARAGAEVIADSHQELAEIGRIRTHVHSPWKLKG